MSGHPDTKDLESSELMRALEDHKRKVALELIERERRLPQVLTNVLQYWKHGPTHRRAAVVALAWTLLSRGTATTVVAGAGIAGVLGLVIAWQANALLQSQNERLDVQTHLAEAQRRSSLVFELTRILDLVGEQRAKTPNTKTLISPSQEVGARIVGLTRSLRPYYYVSYPTEQRRPAAASNLAPTSDLLRLSTLTFGNSIAPQLGSRPLSPERGQLLVSLAAAKVDFLAQSLGGATFSYADFSGTKLLDLDLTSVDLASASFNNSEVRGVVFHSPNRGGPGARLDRADFTCARISGTYFGSATLDGAKFAYVEMSTIHMDAIRQSGMEIPLPEIDSVHLARADLTNADFHGVRLTYGTAFFSDSRNKPVGFEPGKWNVTRDDTDNAWIVTNKSDPKEGERLRQEHCDHDR